MYGRARDAKMAAPSRVKIKQSFVTTPVAAIRMNRLLAK
jgi:hypothetical protein